VGSGINCDPQRHSCRAACSQVRFGYGHKSRTDEPAREIPGDGQAVHIGQAGNRISMAGAPRVAVAGHIRSGISNSLPLCDHTGS